MSDIIQKLTSDDFLTTSLKEQLINTKFEENTDIIKNNTYMASSLIEHSFVSIEENSDKVRIIIEQFKSFYDELYLLLHSKATEYLKNKINNGKFNVYTEHVVTYNKIINSLLFCIEKVIKGDSIDSVNFSKFLNKNSENNKKYVININCYLYLIKKDNDFIIRVYPKVKLLKIRNDGSYIEQEILSFEIITQ